MKPLFTFNIGRSFPSWTHKGRNFEATKVTIGRIGIEDYLKYIHPLRATGLEVSALIQLYDHQIEWPVQEDLRAGSELHVHAVRVEPIHRKLPEGQGYAKDPTLFLTAFIDASKMSVVFGPTKAEEEEEEGGPPF